MATRDILDANGSVIGQIALPDDTSEAEWSARLAQYAGIIPQAPDVLAAAKASILAAMDFGRELIAEFGALNVANGLNPSQVAGVAAKLSSVQALLMSGSLKTAKLSISAITPDSYVTQAVKDDFTQRINDYLGI